MYNDVEKFLDKMNIERQQSPEFCSDEDMKMRHKHMIEEANEFVQSNNMSDLEGCVDALVDVVYVALGTAAMMGLSKEHWDLCWKEVHAANMRKVAGEVKDHKVGVVKPEGWVGPDFSKILPYDNEYPIGED